MRASSPNQLDPATRKRSKQLARRSGALSNDLFGADGYPKLMPNEAEARNAERKLRAAARAKRMTVEVVALGEPKLSPYEFSTPEEGLVAAVRLIEHHQALRGGLQGSSLGVAG